MSYRTLGEARDAGAIARGWLPGALPEGAYELRVAYEPDGRRRWGIVNFPAADADRVRSLLQPDEIPLTGIRVDIPARIEWWPVALRGDLDAERLADTGLRAYRAKTSDLIFAVNWGQGRAYYWVVGH